MTEQEWLTSTDPQAMLRLIDGTYLAGSASEWKSPMKASPRKLRLFACACCWGVSPELGKDAEQLVEWNKYPAGCDNAANWAMAWAGDQKKPTQAERAALLRDIIGNPFRPVTRRCASCNDCFQGQSFSICGNCGGEACTNCADHGRHKDCKFTPQVRDSWSRWLTPTVRSLATATYEERITDGVYCFDCQQSGLAGLKRMWCDECKGKCDPDTRLIRSEETGTLDPDRLAILADALEDAGCEDEDVLRHLRGEERCPKCCGLKLTIDAEAVMKLFDKPMNSDYGQAVIQAVQSGILGNKMCPCGTGWRPLRGSHVRGCHVLDLLLGKE